MYGRKPMWVACYPHLLVWYLTHHCQHSLGCYCMGFSWGSSWMGRVRVNTSADSTWNQETSYQSLPRWKPQWWISLVAHFLLWIIICHTVLWIAVARIWKSLFNWFGLNPSKLALAKLARDWNCGVPLLGLWELKIKIIIKKKDTK